LTLILNDVNIKREKVTNFFCVAESSRKSVPPTRKLAGSLALRTRFLFRKKCELSFPIYQGLQDNHQQIGYWRVCMKLRRFILLLCLLWLPSTASAAAGISGNSLSSLEQIEAFIKNSPEVLAAFSTVARDEALIEREKQKAGAKYFADLTFGYNNEPVYDTSEDKNSYNKLNATIGLNLPLLGSLQNEKIGKLSGETTVLESRQRAGMLIVNNLSALRKAYTALWIEQQKEAMAEKFLNTEPATSHILQERQSQGLVLPAERLEFLAAYTDAKRDLAAAKLRQTQALQLINLATGRSWVLTGKVKAPALPSVDGQTIDLVNHPAILFQHDLAAQYEKLLAAKNRIDREANLTFGVTTSQVSPGSSGTGAYMAFSITEPLKAVGTKDQAKQAAADDLNRIIQEEAFIRLKLAGQVKEALATADYAAAGVTAQEAHLLALAESIREKTLRRQVLPGDTFEQLQYSKAQYYRTALAMLDQEDLFLQSAINIISYVYPRGPAAETAARVVFIDDNAAARTKLLTPDWLEAPSLPADMAAPFDFANIPSLKLPAVPVRLKAENTFTPTLSMRLENLEAAVYIWNAGPFLQNSTKTAALAAVNDAGFTRILLSFTPEQLAAFSTPAGKEELTNLLADAKSKNIRVDLLLGDPTWVEPGHRGEVLTLIKKLQDFAFDGIHLDIEPDSLPAAENRRTELLADLADTVKAVKTIATLPVAITIHPRYLEGELGELAKQKLLPLGLEEIVVMIYTDNPYATAQRMSAIIKDNPKTVFSLAQSVEHNLPGRQSYRDSTCQEFRDAMQVLEANLAVQGLKGIIIQSWEEYWKGEYNEDIVFHN
jgi:hypothetical protein